MFEPSMLNYIFDQPRALAYAFLNRNEYCYPFCNDLRKVNYRKIYLVGSGTSYNAALSIKVYFEIYLPVEVEVVIPTVFTNHTRVNNNNKYKNNEIAVFGISQSGTSFSTIDALRHAQQCGYHTFALTEDLNSPISKYADSLIHLLCGKELIPVETRGYSVTLLQGYLMAIEAAHGMALIDNNKYETVIDNVKLLIDAYEDYLKASDYWYKSNCQELMNYSNAHVAAYGSNIGTALEAELKMYETFRHPVKAYELEEMLHGPNMAFNENTYIFIIAADGFEFARVKKFVDWFRENKVTDHVFVISDKYDEVSMRNLKFNTAIFGELEQLVYVLPFQLLTAYNAKSTGIDTSVRPKNRRSFAHDYEYEVK